MGLGLLGRGVGDARFLAEQGAEVTVTDLKDEDLLKDSVDKLKDLENIRFVLGEHRIEDFQNTDMVIKGAGVPLGSPHIEEARKRGVPIRMSTALFAELTPSIVIGVTGTKGKTTVSYLVHHILKEVGKEVFLGGNARLISTLAYLPQSKKGEISVLELDSWQLQGFAEAGISPPLAIFTNFMPDHLNYYNGDMNAYLEDKASIFINQKKEDLLFLGKDVHEKLKGVYDGRIKSKVKDVLSTDLPPDWIVAIPGEHNRLNASLATSLARSLGVPMESCKRALANFPGISGRLEYRGELNGRKFYNDNNATTPEATVASVDALKEEGRVILIAGGADKNLPPENLKKAIESSIFQTFLLPGSGTDKLKKITDPLKIKEVPDVKQALESAYSVSKEGDIILFSPAFASFSQFSNEYEREKVFLKELERISSNNPSDGVE